MIGRTFLRISLPPIRDRHRAPTAALAVALVAVASASGCGNRQLDDASLHGSIPYTFNPPTLGTHTNADPYTGSDPTVIDAQARLATGLDLQKGVILRTCGPTGGVCHNAKEYPDLHTPANFLNAISANCNIQPGTYAGVFDGCERVGDKLQLGDVSPIEIGWFEFVPGDYNPATDGPPKAGTPATGTTVADPGTPGLHFELRKAPGRSFDDRYYTASFMRPFSDGTNSQLLSVFDLSTSFWSLTGPNGEAELFARVPEYLGDDVQRLMTIGIVQGDANHNGVFGADTAGNPIHLLEPGKPEDSYLIGRLRGKIHDAPIPGTRMPLANQPLDTPEMLAMFCFVEGLVPGAATDLSSPINYKDCTYSSKASSLNLLGNGATWAARIKDLFLVNCGGCHGITNPLGNLTLVGDGAYQHLLGKSWEDGTMNLVTPGSPETSYLYLKLIGAGMGGDGGAAATGTVGTTGTAASSSSSSSSGGSTSGTTSATSSNATTGGGTTGGGPTTGGASVSSSTGDIDAGADDSGFVMAVDPAIKGLQMPLDATNKPRPLSQTDIDAVRSWIQAGAIENQ